MIIAVVGSGGKTTLIKKLAAQYRREGKTVLVTTTTHMFIEEDTLLTDDADTVIGALRETGYAMAGIPEGQKIKALSKETFDTLCKIAEVVLVEADGSKHMPLKYPNATEPVYATLLIHKNQIIGGDITDTAAKGLIQGLKKATATPPPASSPDASHS